MRTALELTAPVIRGIHKLMIPLVPQRRYYPVKEKGEKSPLGRIPLAGVVNRG